VGPQRSRRCHGAGGSATLEAAIDNGGKAIALNETESGSDRDGRRDSGEPGLVGRSIDEFVTQLRGFTERARSLAGGASSALSLPALPSPPGALSAAQVAAVAQTVSAQRQQIAAMSSQLEAFDKQLAVFERILEPLVAWSSSWARLEEAFGSLTRGEGTGTSA
jgi:hypothetical protein